MSHIANKISFWELLSSTKITIPILQRDYAQGRIGYESLRERFLSSLLEALKSSKELLLDFIYGSTTTHAKEFCPIDGQQRLTTLWLLHWYIAYKSGKLKENYVQKYLLNFTYATRNSSEQFCHRLVTQGMSIKQEKSESITTAIMRQTWFPTQWCQDPTIQAMLRMLGGEKNDQIDGIEEVLQDASDYEKYWEVLTSPDGSPIVFYQLDLENINQSDDLYIKLNARGCPLSDFENFKADLIKYISDKQWSTLLDPKEGIPILLDTQWTDFFWKYRQNKEIISLDDMLFGFINRFFLVRLMRMDSQVKLEENELGQQPIDKTIRFLYSFTETKEKRLHYSQTGFSVYNILFEHIDDWSTLYDLRTILCNVSNFVQKWGRNRLTECIKYPYANTEERPKFEFVYTSGKDNLFRLTIQETIVFWATCRFFLNPNIYCTPENLKQWIRVVWNVCSYSHIDGDEIRNRDALRSAIRSIDATIKNTYNVCDIRSWDMSKFTDQQNVTEQHITEEYQKIKQLNKGQYDGTIEEFKGLSWYEVILKSEKLPYFKGTIRTLFYDDNGIIDWNKFDVKYQRLQKYWKSDKFGNKTYKDYLHYAFETIHDAYWYSDESKRLLLWRKILPYNRHEVNSWLLQSATIHSKPNGYPEYITNMILNTELLEEVTHIDGMYLTYSYTYGYHVFMHHQKSSPYILFNENRNKILQNTHNQGNLCVLNYETIHKPCGVFDAKDIIFEYEGKRYTWDAYGCIYANYSPNIRLFEQHNSDFYLVITILQQFLTNDNRTIHLVERFETAGIIGADQGAKGREVLIQDPDILEQKLHELGVC